MNEDQEVQITRNEYIDDLISEFYAGTLTLFVMELSNSEKIIALCDIIKNKILYLPIHMIEYIEDSNDVSYRLYPYHNIADATSELILSEQPYIMFAPKPQLIDAFFGYWEKVKASPDIYDLSKYFNEQDSEFDFAIISAQIS